MKVIVRCIPNRVTKTEMEREIERLFQENKDLRLSEAHLRDELNIVRQQSEARRQKMVEKDARLAEVCAQRDNFEASYKQVTQWWENEQTKARKETERAEEYRIALMESDARVDELEKRVEWLQHERQLYANNVERLTRELNAAVKGNAELIEENAELRDNLDAVINIKNEYAETIDEMRKKIVAAQSTEFTAHLAKLIIANLPSTDQ